MQLYVAIRSGNWSRRNSALKHIVVLFTAFDQHVYKVLIPHHLADVLEYPKEIVSCFEAGGFTVSMNGQDMNNIALDEAHEMAINKDMKIAVVRPSTEYLQKTAIFLTIAR